MHDTKDLMPLETQIGELLGCGVSPAQLEKIKGILGVSDQGGCEAATVLGGVGGCICAIVGVVAFALGFLVGR